jgi:hypothetical protein
MYLCIMIQGIFTFRDNPSLLHASTVVIVLYLHSSPDSELAVYVRKQYSAQGNGKIMFSNEPSRLLHLG